MTYQDFVVKMLSESSKENFDSLMLTACLGLAGETGEFVDSYKKVKFQNKELNKEKFIDELGDVSFYLHLACHSLGTTLAEVNSKNIEKLIKRYPNGCFEKSYFEIKENSK